MALGVAEFEPVDAVREHAACVVGETAADGHHRHAVLASRRRDAGRRLAEGGLEVDAPLAGDGESGTLHVVLEPRRRDDEFHAALQG